MALRRSIRSFSSVANPMDKFKNLPTFPVFDDVAGERLNRKQKLAAAFRIFAKLGFDEGVAGHITARDPEFTNTFWVNPFGVHFSLLNVSSLIRVDENGVILEGKGPLNAAAFAIHSNIHKARPDVVAAAHTHSIYGRALSTLGIPLTINTQDACAFHDDFGIYDDYQGVVLENDEGQTIGKVLGQKKALIMKHHGLLTVGQTVDAAVWWYICMERCCQVELLARSTGLPSLAMSREAAEQAKQVVGTPHAGWFQFQPMYQSIIKEQPDLLL